MSFLADLSKGLMGAVTGNPMAIIDAGLSFIGGQKTNDANKNSAKATMDFEAKQQNLKREFEHNEAQTQMAFQSDQAQTSRDYTERLSNSAHTREVEDLRNAGLNPILSATGGSGASTPSSPTPSGASGTSGAASGVMAHLEDSIGKAVSSARATRELKNATERTKQEIAQSKETTENIKDERLNIHKTGNEIQSRTLLNQASTAKAVEEANKASVQTAVEKQMLKNSAYQNDILQKQLQELNYKMPGLEFEKHLDESYIGKIGRGVNRINPLNIFKRIGE